MINDFEKLKNIDYTKFKNERVSSNLKELIDKTNNAIIGKIYDLQSKNLLSSINNISENNQNSSNANNNYPGGSKEGTKIEQIINNNGQELSSETKNVIRGSNPNGNQNFFVNRDAIQTNVIFNDKREENVILDDIRKYDVKFVLKLIGFEDKLNAKIKCSPKIDINYINPEDGYIINHEIIDCYKEFYNEQSLRHFLSPNNEMYNIYKKYSNTYNYISEVYLDNFSKEAAEKLPKEYIEEIQKKNDYAFSSQKQSVQLYQPTINYHRDQQYYYFENCVLISQKVSNHLLSDIKNNDNIIHKIQKVKFMIANGKLFLIHNSNIYYGKINEKAMYIPEIMICCYNQDELAKLIYELKINQIHYILRQTRKKDNNIPDIGIYKNTNIISKE